MARNVVKYLFYFLSYFYVYRKLLNLKPLLFKQKVAAGIFSLFFSFSMHFICSYMPRIRFILLTISFFIYMQIHTHLKISLNFITSIITIALSNIFYTISVFLTALLISPIYYNRYDLPWVPLQICIGILQYLLLHLLFHIRRFRKGMPFLYQPHTTNAGIVFSIITLICITIAGIPNITNYVYVSFPVFILIPTACIFAYWWLHKITQNYLTRLHKTEIASLETELKEKDALIAHIEEDNQRLAAIIHRDNKLIPSMELAVYDFLSAGNKYSPIEREKLGLTLARELQSMSRNRRDELSSPYLPEQVIPTTEIPTVDILLSFLHKRASEWQISYSVTVDSNLTNLTSEEISVEDLTHLLADLIENAIIASKECTTKNVSIHFYFCEKYYAIEVSDSGPYFDIKTFDAFGLMRHTTHKELGGSGIGLMNIWQTKNKYQASLIISEYPESEELYTKKILFAFDKKNRFILRTFRKNEVQAGLHRCDLTITDYTLLSE